MFWLLFCLTHAILFSVAEFLSCVLVISSVVEFASASDMKNAITKLNGKELNGRAIELSEDKPRSSGRSRRSRSRSDSRSRSRSRSRRSDSHSRSRSRSRSRGGDRKDDRSSGARNDKPADLASSGRAAVEPAANNDRGAAGDGHKSDRSHSRSKSKSPKSP